MKKVTARQRGVGIAALATSFMLALAPTLPAMAADARYGSKSCTTLVGIASTTVAVPTQTFYKTSHYATPGGSRSWGVPGSHYFLSSAYSTNWSILTDGRITSANVTCSTVQ